MRRSNFRDIDLRNRRSRSHDNRLRLLNSRYCQQSGSMSAAQVCGGENDAEGDCRQSQSQLDRVSFAHLCKLLRT